MQTCEAMGDARHKNPPPPGEDEEDVTDDFIRDARAAMTTNLSLNGIISAKEGDPAYLIDSQAALARELSRRMGRKVSDKHISNILGPVRKNSKWDRVYQSTYVGPIRDALNLPTLVTVAVPAARAATIQQFALVPDNVFADFARTLATKLQQARESAASSRSSTSDGKPKR